MHSAPFVPECAPWWLRRQRGPPLRMRTKFGYEGNNICAALKHSNDEPRRSILFVLTLALLAPVSFSAEFELRGAAGRSTAGDEEGVSAGDRDEKDRPRFIGFTTAELPRIHKKNTTRTQ